MKPARRAAANAPDRGDVVWLTFDSQTGHEQAGRRPSVVISPRAYNSRSGLVLVCPITTSIKGHPFEVVIPSGVQVSGAVLADQLRTFDWRARRVARVCALPAEAMDEVLEKLHVLIGRD